jgi:hypothetical protein
MAHCSSLYSRQDMLIIDRLRADWQRAGRPVWIDRIGLTPGTPGC